MQHHERKIRPHAVIFTVCGRVCMHDSFKPCKSFYIGNMHAELQRSRAGGNLQNPTRIYGVHFVVTVHIGG